MPTRDTPPPGAPCWVDLMSSDPARSSTFYCDLLGWTADEPDEAFGGYFSFRRDGVLVAGCMAAQPGSPADMWSVYLATDDAAKTVEAAQANGGKVLVEPMAVGDLGTMAYLADPSGAAIGLWQPGTHPGFTVYAENNAPAWFELHTRQFDQAVAFYRDVFRWETHAMSDAPEFRYTILQHGEEMLAGVMDATGHLPEGVPDHWAVYFGVADADAAVARTVELGGSVLRPAEDTPYGRIAVVADATGAGFRLVAPNEAMPAREG
ncbi:MAG TPA: VOC family protein [Acidimicrobiales bacterium]|nr:VOC family protein [Acidimicrobiales bacterium]